MIDYRYLYMLALVLLISCRGNDNKSDAYGNFETDETIVSSETAGKLVFFDTELGDHVTKGDLLAIADTSQLRLQIREVKTQRKSVETKKINIRAQVGVEQEQIKNLRITQNRIHNLFKDKAATQQQVDDVDGQMRVFEKQQESLNTQFVSVNSEIAVLNARTKVLEDQFRKCFVRSPLTGVVMEKYAEMGEVLSPGKAIVKIGDLSELDLRVFVSGAQLPGIKLGQEVQVLIDEDRKNNQALTGTVSWISPEAEFTPKIIQTKEERVKLVYAVRVKVKNDGRLKIGMPGEVNF